MICSHGSSNHWTVYVKSPNSNVDSKCQEESEAGNCWPGGVKRKISWKTIDLNRVFKDDHTFRYVKDRE